MAKKSKSMPILFKIVDLLYLIHRENMAIEKILCLQSGVKEETIDKYIGQCELNFQKVVLENEKEK